MAKIIDAAKAAGDFTTLLKAVEAAGLTRTLSGEGPFTVFAPSDEAFANLPEGTLEDLLGKPEKLKAILTYHVVPGRLLAADVVQAKSLKTVQGKDLDVQRLDGTVKIGSARVTAADLNVDNGVIHIIDGVLLPN